MRTSKLPEHQIPKILKEVDDGRVLQDVCREYGNRQIQAHRKPLPSLPDMAVDDVDQIEFLDDLEGGCFQAEGSSDRGLGGLNLGNLLENVLCGPQVDLLALGAALSLLSGSFTRRE